VWINETGFATTHGRTERDQALWWARAVPTFLAQPGIEHVGVYEIKDLRPTRDAIGGAENYHLGITDTLRRPKQAFDAVRLLVRLFGVDSIAVLDSALDVRVTDAPAARYGPFVHAFLRPDGRQIVAVWTRRGSPSVTVRLARSGRRAIDYDLAGHGRPIARFDGVTLPAMRLTPEDVRIVEILP
jgi:hypothetical protein